VFAQKGGRTGSLVTRAALLILLGVLTFLTPMLFASMLTVLTGFAIILSSFLAVTVSFFIRRTGVRACCGAAFIGLLGTRRALFATARVAPARRLRKARQRIKAAPQRNRPDDGGGDVISGEIID